MDILSIVLSILGAVGTIAMLGVPLMLMWIEKRIAAGVDHALSKKLETHRHELALAADVTRFDHQRKLHEFQLYVEKKHQVHARLWQLLRGAEGAVLGLTGFRTEPTFEEFNVHDLQVYMRDLHVAEGKIVEVAELWTQDRNDALKELRKYKRLHELNAARRSRQRALNYLLSYELYLAETTVSVIHDYLEMLRHKLFRAEQPEIAREVAERYTDESYELKMAEIRPLLRRELTASYEGGATAVIHIDSSA